MLIAFSVCLLAAIILCNFALIFCRRIPCLFEGGQHVSNNRSDFSLGFSGQNHIGSQLISIDELSKIAPIKKYSDISNRYRKRDYGTCNKNSSFSGHTSSNSTQKSKNSYSCVICLNNIYDEDLVRTLPCRHIYHFKCIDEWVKIKSNCPLCNVNLSSINHQNTPERESIQTPNTIQNCEEVEFSEGNYSVRLIPDKLLA
ncbi:ring finger-containing protein [Cryptosporidium canis]|uniref:Ring finger-containing protein n=1 Tax=Cryptosporidium canis TaxID=195482 RepID=A0A9D5HXL6_9CRYT|nr:ring finger-containing protein [Cryptosporidium canis]